MQNDIYACFINYTKAFEKIRHEDMLQVLRDLLFDGKEIKLVINLFWDQTVAIRINMN